MEGQIPSQKGDSDNPVNAGQSTDDLASASDKTSQQPSSDQSHSKPATKSANRSDQNTPPKNTPTDPNNANQNAPTNQSPPNQNPNNNVNQNAPTDQSPPNQNPNNNANQNAPTDQSPPNQNPNNKNKIRIPLNLAQILKRTSIKNFFRGKSVGRMIVWFCAAILIFSLGCVGYEYLAEPWSEPQDIRVTNVTSRSATISWVTEEPTKGFVIFSTEDDFNSGILARFGKKVSVDDRDLNLAVLEAAEKERENISELDGAEIDYESVAEDVVLRQVGEYYVHHVTLGGLDPEQDYYFMVGNGYRFAAPAEEQTVAFTVAEGNSFSTYQELDEIRVPDPTYGMVVSDMLPVDDGIMFMKIKGLPASPMSAVLNENGSWYIDLSNMRTIDGEQFGGYVESQNYEELYVEGGKYGQSEVIENPMSVDAPAAPMVLEGEAEVESMVPQESGVVSSVYAQSICDGESEYETFEEFAGERIYYQCCEGDTTPHDRGYNCPDNTSGEFCGTECPAEQQPDCCYHGDACSDGNGICHYEPGAPIGESCGTDAYWRVGFCPGSANVRCCHEEPPQEEPTSTGCGEPRCGPSASACWACSATGGRDPSCTWAECTTNGTWRTLPEGNCCGEKLCDYACSGGGDEPPSSEACYINGDDASNVYSTDSQTDCNGYLRSNFSEEEQGELICKQGFRNANGTGATCWVIKLNDAALTRAQCIVGSSIIEMAENGDAYFSANGCENARRGLDSDGQSLYRCEVGDLDENGDGNVGDGEDQQCSVIFAIENQQMVTTCLFDNVEMKADFYLSENDCEKKVQDYYFEKGLRSGCVEGKKKVDGEVVNGMFCYRWVESRTTCSNSDRENPVGISDLCTCSAGCWCPVQTDNTFNIPHGQFCAVHKSDCDEGEYINQRCDNDDGTLYCVGGGKCAVPTEVLPSGRDCTIDMNEQCPADCLDGCHCLDDEAGATTFVNTEKYCAVGSDSCSSKCNTGNACYVFGDVGEVRYCNKNQYCVKMSSNDACILRNEYAEGCQREVDESCDPGQGQNSGAGGAQNVSYLPDITKLIPSAEAQNSLETENGLVLIPEMGVYSLSIGSNFAVEGLEVTAEEGVPIFLYFEKNDVEGYQQGEDEEVDVAAFEISLTRESSLRKYNIREGYNSISFPIIPDTVGGGNMAKAMLEYLNEQYDGAFYSLAKFESGRWVVVENRDGQSYGGEDFQIIPGEGYILKANKDVMITITGKEVKDPVPVWIIEGWNLISVHGSSQSYTASSLLDSLDLVGTLDADNVSYWDTDRSRYDGLQKEEDDDGTMQVYGFDFPIVDTSGYFVRVVEGRGTWTPE